MENLKDKDLTPTIYFETVKSKRQTITDDELKNVYDNCLALAKKYIAAGQTSGAEKLVFHLQTIEKEREIVKQGIDTFVYRDDIEYFIDNIAKDVVKIIELERYEREIPDEIVDILVKLKDKFDAFYIVFTDYTGAIERQVEEERRDKDPILFGVFRDNTSKSIVDRFYYIGDWVDEYCDLTLAKMMSQIEITEGVDIRRKISTPASLSELKEQLEHLKKDSKGDFRMQPETEVVHKKSFFDKVKTFFKG